MHNRYRSLRRFFNFVADELGLPVSPMDRMKPPRLEEKVVRPYTPEEVERMIDACPFDWMGLRDAALIWVLFDTGLRLDECLQIRVGDLRENRITVRGKGAKERVVRLGHGAQLAVHRYLLRRPFEGEYLWVGRYGDRLLESGLAVAVRRAGKRAGVPGANVHRFRHTYACQYLLAGGDRGDLQESLGHATDVMTKRYVRFAAQERALRAHETFSPGDRIRPRRRGRKGRGASGA